MQKIAIIEMSLLGEGKLFDQTPELVKLLKDHAVEFEKAMAGELGYGEFPATDELDKVFRASDSLLPDVGIQDTEGVAMVALIRLEF